MGFVRYPYYVKALGALVDFTPFKITPFLAPPCISGNSFLLDVKFTFPAGYYNFWVPIFANRSLQFDIEFRRKTIKTLKKIQHKFSFLSRKLSSVY